jgi:predicted small secreted protein
MKTIVALLLAISLSLSTVTCKHTVKGMAEDAEITGEEISDYTGGIREEITEEIDSEKNKKKGNKEKKDR